MTGKQKLGIGVVLVGLLGSAAATLVARAGDRGVEVTLEEVTRRDLVESITASGFVRARRTVSISSDVSARVAEVAVAEGDEVVAGQMLLRLDPSQLDAAVARAEAALSQARAQQSNQNSNLLRAQRDYDRLAQLRARDSVLVSRQQIDDAATALDIAQAQLEASGYGVQQALASLDEARDRLSKTVITAPMPGKITRVNIEEGETAVIGTMNNPGSLLLTISDLSTIEVVVQVDETEVPHISLGDSTAVEIDAFPDVPFTGRVTEIGQSAVRPPASNQGTGQQTAIDFQVVITLDPAPVMLRPDLSATAEIVTETRKDVVSVPIIALTVRDSTTLSGWAAEADAAGGEAAEAARAAALAARSTETGDVEGVFLARGGTVTFVPVQLGITGTEYFEAVRGLEVGDTVVAGPYQTIRTLEPGQAVQATEVTAGPPPSTP